MLWILLSGCCRDTPQPILMAPNRLELQAGDTATIPWTDILVDHTYPMEKLTYQTTTNMDGISLRTGRNHLEITSDTETEGNGVVSLTVVDKCEQQATVDIPILVANPDPTEEECGHTFKYPLD